MKKLAESQNYVISYEYEMVFLDIKKENRNVHIGSFYGDPCTAIISEDERFCAIGGEGVIIYYLTPPYENYNENKLTSQWKEWARNGNVVWVEQILQIDTDHIEITTEFNEKIILKV